MPLQKVLLSRLQYFLFGFGAAIVGLIILYLCQRYLDFKVLGYFVAFLLSLFVIIPYFLMLTKTWGQRIYNQPEPTRIQTENATKKGILIVLPSSIGLIIVYFLGKMGMYSSDTSGAIIFSFIAFLFIGCGIGMSIVSVFDTKRFQKEVN